MTSLCTALANALRKCAEKMPEKFELWHPHFISMRKSDPHRIIPFGGLTDTTQFTLDHMDAVAAALGMEFGVQSVLTGWVWQANREGSRGRDVLASPSGERYPSKREASLAALLAIITHALQEDKQ